MKDGDSTKQEFLHNIHSCQSFDESFFKKCYGYSYLDKKFLRLIAIELKKINRLDVIKDYNEWYIRYENDKHMTIKKVANWYLGECKIKNKNFKEPVKKEGRNPEWQKRKRELLLKKKKLILMQSLKRSTENLQN